MIRIEDVAFDFAMARKVGFDFDRDKRIGASEVGQCSRKTAYKKLRTPPDPGSKPTSGFAVRGDVMEDNWIAPLCREWIKANGGELLYSGQANQTSFAGKNTVLSATPDGLAINVARDILKDRGVPDIGKSKSLVIEMKSIDPHYKEDNLPKGPHTPQTLTQLGMIRHATKHRPDYGVIVYVDASDYFKIHRFPVKWDEKQFKGLVNRSSKLLSAKDPNQFPRKGRYRVGRSARRVSSPNAAWAGCLGLLAMIRVPRRLSKSLKSIRLLSVSTKPSNGLRRFNRKSATTRLTCTVC